MKKVLIGFLLSVLMIGCVSSIGANMRTSQDVITGNTVYYGYSWTTGSENVTHDFNKKTNLSATLIMDSVTKEKKIMYSVMKIKDAGSTVSLLSTKEDELVEKLTGKDSYTLDIQEVKITNGKDEFIVKNVGKTKKEFQSMGTPIGNSTVTFPIQDKDLDQLEKIYNSERVILVAKDVYGKDHLGLIKDKSGMLELLNLVKTN
jgi:uncharacterized protein YcfL